MSYHTPDGPVDLRWDNRLKGYEVTPWRPPPPNPCKARTKPAKRKARRKQARLSRRINRRKR